MRSVTLDWEPVLWEVSNSDTSVPTPYFYAFLAAVLNADFESWGSRCTPFPTWVLMSTAVSWGLAFTITVNISWEAKIFTVSVVCIDGVLSVFDQGIDFEGQIVVLFEE